MTSIVGLFVCPCFACILAVMLGYVAQYSLIFLVWHWCVAMYLNLYMYWDCLDYIKIWAMWWLSGHWESQRNINSASGSPSWLGGWRSAIWCTCSLYTKSAYGLGKPKALLIGNAGWLVCGMLPSMLYIHTFFVCVCWYASVILNYITNISWVSFCALYLPGWFRRK